MRMRSIACVPATIARALCRDVGFRGRSASSIRRACRFKRIRRAYAIALPGCGQVVLVPVQRRRIEQVEHEHEHADEQDEELHEDLPAARS